MSRLRITFLRSPVATAIAVVCALGWFAWLGCSNDATGPGPPPPTKGKDEVPPAQITDPVLSYAAGEGAELSWSAPRDDADHERVDRYDIRFSYSLPFDWDVSIHADNPPAPVAPDSLQTYVYPAPVRGTELYAAIRSYDAAGNASPISPVAVVHIPGYTVSGVCVGAVSGAPVQGLAVTLTSRHVHVDTTDATGTFSVSDVSGGVAGITIHGGVSEGTWHSIDYGFLLDRDISRTYSMIPYQPIVSAYYDNVFQVFLDAAQLTGGNKIFKKWRSLPVPLYIPDFTNSYGLDYGATARSAAQRWMDRTGITLFSFVSQEPDTGVTFFYKTRAEMGIQNGITKHVDDADGYPIQDLVSIIDEFSDQQKLYETMLHELGHTIRFAHLPVPWFIMYAGQPLPGDISDPEVQAVQLYTSLPNGLDVSIYDSDAPVARASGATR